MQQELVVCLEGMAVTYWVLGAQPQDTKCSGAGEPGGVQLLAHQPRDPGGCWPLGLGLSPVQQSPTGQVGPVSIPSSLAPHAGGWANERRERLC